MTPTEQRLSDLRQRALEAVNAMLDAHVEHGSLCESAAQAGSELATALTHGATIQCAPFNALDAMLRWVRLTGAQVSL